MNKEKVYKIVVIYIVPLLLSLFLFLLSFNSTKSLSFTTDETSHLARGVMLIRTGDYRINQHHPILFNVLHSIPVALDVDFNTIPLDGKLWEEARKDEIGMELVWLNGGRENYSLQFLSKARLTAGLISSTLVFLVYQIIRKLFGVFPAIFSTVVYLFSPTVIAHSSLVTTDTASMFTIFLASLALFYDIKKGEKNKKHMPFLFIVTALIAILSKYTAVLLLPFWIIIYIYAMYKNANVSFRTILLRVALIIVTLILLLTAVYGFKFRTIYEVEYENPDKIDATYDHIATLNRLLPIISVNSMEYLYTKIKLPFPEYIKGFYDNVIKHNIHGHKTYLLGQANNGGNRLYFPVAFLSKETVPFIALSIFSSIYLVIYVTSNRKTLLSKTEFLPLYVTPTLLLFMTLISSINIGIRHLLPLYPFLALSISYTVYKLLQSFPTKKTIILSIISVIISLHIILSVSHYPFYISYFNQIVGAEKYNYLYLQDSNFDWEQEAFMAENKSVELKDTNYVVYPKEAISGNIDILEKWQRCVRYRFFRNELTDIEEYLHNYYIFKYESEEKVCDF